MKSLKYTFAKNDIFDEDTYVTKDKVIPKNYYCNFELTLRQNTTYNILVIREYKGRASMKFDETIEALINIKSKKVGIRGGDFESYINDLAFQKNTRISLMKSLSQAQLVFTNMEGNNTLHFFVRNNKRQTNSKFNILIQNQRMLQNMNALRFFQSMVTFCCCTMCFFCCFKTLKHGCRICRFRLR